MMAIRVPYRLGTDHFCEYEGDGSPVLMGDMVTVVVPTYDGSDCEESGELSSVRYGGDGFIQCVSLYCKVASGFEMERDVLCEGVFYRMETDDANQ
ncbi:hypothetical protein [Olsenella uli]|uniref:hypothetical protein n=1 Tax=Olsenella uli TaxID=133926 RepID=UPI00241FEC7F|nr:hypothetical protein [Olsenella uli]